MAQKNVPLVADIELVDISRCGFTVKQCAQVQREIVSRLSQVQATRVANRVVFATIGMGNLQGRVLQNAIGVLQARASEVVKSFAVQEKQRRLVSQH